MKIPFDPRALTFDAKAINETIERALASAGLDTKSGPMQSVTETISQALAQSGMADAAKFQAAGMNPLEAMSRIMEQGPGGKSPPNTEAAAGEAELLGAFETREFSNRAGTRAYKLYVPAGIEPGASPPMMVMLHGCTQSAQDFAEGTRMNRLADEHGFLVVYPEQAQSANTSKCWNWFKSPDQIRDSGEPMLIAGMVREVAERHGADPRRIYVAGLSAGAAMAVILGETYPDIFAGIGAHSGLPYGSAHDIPSALATMKGGRSGIAGLNGLPAAAAPAPRKAERAVPTIVFHGDRDHTVHQSNGDEIVRQAALAHGAGAEGAASPVQTKEATSAGGRTYTRTTYAAANGEPRIESWTIHGAGHAWSGGSARGSFTDGTGPDASAEMVRFFLALPGSGSA